MAVPTKDVAPPKASHDRPSKSKKPAGNGDEEKSCTDELSVFVVQRSCFCAVDGGSESLSLVLTLPPPPPPVGWQPTPSRLTTTVQAPTTNDRGTFRIIIRFLLYNRTTRILQGDAAVKAKSTGGQKKRP
jgi:hypothetical protein